MTSPNNITQYLSTSNTIAAEDMRIDGSLHPSPSSGWYRTNKLDHCTIDACGLNLHALPHRMIHDLSVTTKGSKTIECGKNYVGLFCPVTWNTREGNRRIDAVDSIHAMVLDIDGVTPGTTEDILSRLSQVCYVAYTSFSHRSPIKDGKDAFRVVIPFTRPCTQQEYKTVWECMQSCIPENDIQTKDPSRLWFLPSFRIDRADSAWKRHNNGHALDVDKMLQYKASPKNKEDNGRMAPNTTPDITPANNDNSRYTIAQVPAHWLIQCDIDGDTVTHPFSWYIKNWKRLQKNRSGNLPCYAHGSETHGSAFITRKVDPLTNIARYRCTEQNSNRRNLDCIATDGGIEICYGNRGASWSALKSPDNICAMIVEMGLEIWECAVRNKPFFGSEPLSDSLELEIMTKIRQRYFVGRDIALIRVQQAIQLHASRNRIHPIKEYLDGLEWDGEFRLGRLFIDFLKAQDTPLNHVYAIKWAISAVARIYKPGCKVDTMVVFNAPQGHGKGTFFRTMAGECTRTGYSWYNSSKINIGEKDGRSILSTAWIHEMAELASMAKKDANVVKNFLDEQYDTFRGAYQKHEKKIARGCIFGGSANDKDMAIFRDHTGSRRYWLMVLIGKAHHMAYDPKELEKVRDQLWAEAVAAYKEGKEWWLTPEEQQLSSEENNKHKVTSIHETMVQQWLDDNPCRFFTIKEMMEEVYTEELDQTIGPPKRVPTVVRPMSYENYYPDLLKRLDAVLQNSGKACRRNGKNRRGWWQSPKSKLEDIPIATIP